MQRVTVFKRMATPIEIAKMALFLASDDSSYRREHHSSSTGAGARMAESKRYRSCRPPMAECLSSALRDSNDHAMIRVSLASAGSLSPRVEAGIPRIQEA
jgi:hypothetical protein